MKQTIAFASLLLLAPSSMIAAERWSAEQREVLAHLEQCWAAWADAVQAKDYSIWESRCRPTEDLLWWWTADAVPSTKKTVARRFQWQAEHIKRVVWWDVRPIDVTIVGDVAVVHFYSRGSTNRGNGEPLDFSSKRVELFRRTGGQWSFLGGMVDPENNP